MTERMFSPRDLMARWRVSRTTIWRKVRAGTLAPPIEIGDNAIRWTDKMVEDHEKSRPRRTYGAKDAPEVAA